MPFSVHLYPKMNKNFVFLFLVYSAEKEPGELLKKLYKQIKLSSINSNLK